MKRILAVRNVIDYREQIVVGQERVFIKGKTEAEIFEKIKKHNHSESYCHPKQCLSVVSKRHKAAFDAHIHTPTDMRYWS